LFCWVSQPKEAKLDQKSLKQLEDWTWQFVIVRPVVSILIVILELLGWYEGAITWICSIILNISVSLAMYSLILIYHVFHNELIPRKPLAKILCIKGVVFFSFWQVNLSLSLSQLNGLFSLC
jgi:membrane protein YdbS with pleckstrin-like domain